MTKGVYPKLVGLLLVLLVVGLTLTACTPDWCKKCCEVCEKCTACNCAVPTPTATTVPTGATTTATAAAVVATPTCTATQAEEQQCVDASYRTKTVESQPWLGVYIHLLENCGWEGQIHDIHIYIWDIYGTDELIKVYEEVFTQPMPVCQTKQFIFQLPENMTIAEWGGVLVNGRGASPVVVDLTCAEHLVRLRLTPPYAGPLFE